MAGSMSRVAGDARPLTRASAGLRSAGLKRRIPDAGGGLVDLLIPLVHKIASRAEQGAQAESPATTKASAGFPV